MSATARHLGKYELRQLLGRGSIGEVWLAYDLQLRRNVAVKILHNDLQSDPQFFARLTQEGQLLTSLHHASIVQVHEVSVARSPQQNEAIAYIVMEYIEGGTLADFIRTTSHEGNFPAVDQLAYLFSRLGMAIDYAHQKQVIHGNIKPGNILLDRRDTTQFAAGEPLLVDFGLMQLLSNRGGTVFSSPHYISPEQARGLPPNSRSDIYALGVILYEICTGVQPFRDDNAVAVMMQHINALPTPPILINPNIPAALSEVILRAMAKDPATRFSSAAALSAAIAEACSLQVTLQHNDTTLSAPGSLLAEQEDRRNQPSIPILGVSQPLADERLPFSPTPRISQPLPGSSPLPPASSSRPLPVIPPSSSSPSFPPGSRVSHPLPALPPSSNRSLDLSAPATASYPALQTKSELPTVRVPSAAPPALPPPASQSFPATPSQSLPLPRRRRAGEVPLYVVVSALVLLLLVIGSAIGGSLLLNRSANMTTPTRQAFFQDDALGINDRLRIEMQNVTPPPTGKIYVAWLQGSDNQTLQLGTLTVQNNTISFLYPGDSKHTNLLSIAQAIIITQEDAGSRPIAPTGAVVYRGSFDPKILPYLKNILYVTPGIPGNQSVVKGLLETIKSMNDKAGSIVDSLQGSHDYPLAKRQATRILELIDGTKFAQASGDIPPGVPPLLNVQIGLLSSPDQQGYLDILSQQLAHLKQAAGKQSHIQQRIQNVENAIADLRDWLRQMRTDASQILKAPDFTAPAMLDAALRLKQLAADAYTGRTIPPNQNPQPVRGSAGAYQAYIEAQYMATLDLQAA